jgi:hypothetical protein
VLFQAPSCWHCSPSACMTIHPACTASGTCWVPVRILGLLEQGQQCESHRMHVCAYSEPDSHLIRCTSCLWCTLCVLNIYALPSDQAQSRSSARFSFLLCRFIVVGHNQLGTRHWLSHAHCAFSRAAACAPWWRSLAKRLGVPTHGYQTMLVPAEL